MKKMHKGEVSLSVAGKIEVSNGGCPDIHVNGKDVAGTIADALGLSKENYDRTDFAGKVTLIIECFDEEPEIKNTMVESEDEIKEVSEEENAF